MNYEEKQLYYNDLSKKISERYILSEYQRIIVLQYLLMLEYYKYAVFKADKIIFNLKEFFKLKKSIKRLEKEHYMQIKDLCDKKILIALQDDLYIFNNDILISL